MRDLCAGSVCGSPLAAFHHNRLCTNRCYWMCGCADKQVGESAVYPGDTSDGTDSDAQASPQECDMSGLHLAQRILVGTQDHWAIL